MSRTTFIIIVTIIILIIAGVFGYLFFQGGGGTVTTAIPSVRNLFPFGNSSGNQKPVETDPDTIDNEQPAETDTNQTPTERPRLIKLVAKPVAGFTFIDKLRPITTTEVINETNGTPPAETVTPKNSVVVKKAPDGTIIPEGMEIARAVRYVEATTGNIYDIFIDTLDERRITNTTIPRIREVFFTDSGKNVILRYLDDDNETIESYLATLPVEIPGGDSEGSLAGTFLDKNIRSFAVSPDTKKIFYMTPTTSGVVGTLADAKMGERNQIFSSPFTEWTPSFVTDKKVALSTKPSGRFDGFIYTLDTTTRAMEKFLSGGSGFMAKISPNEKSALFSLRTEIGTSLRLFDATTSTFQDLSTGTLVDKCIWKNDSLSIFCAVPTYLPSAIYPDDWYMGMVSLTDTIVQIDPRGIFDNRIITDPFASLNEAVDGVHLLLDSSSDHLLFSDKKTQNVYMYTF